MGYLTAGANNTRGILTGVAAGEYEIEFIAFQRAGSAYFEVYAAEGAFQDDSETDQWQLIGAPGGWTIIAGPKPSAKMTLLGLAKVNDRVTIDFTSTDPGGQHQLQESVDLKSWQPVTGATFEKTGGDGVRAIVNGVTGNARFYRVAATAGTP